MAQEENVLKIVKNILKDYRFALIGANAMPPVDILIADKPWELSLLANAVPLEDFDMKVSDPAHLILTKLYSSSEIGLIDIRNLVLFPIEDIDIKKIKGMIKKFLGKDKLNLFLKTIYKTA